MKQKVTVELDIPDGWEATGEYRAPRAGENYLEKKRVFLTTVDLERMKRIILKKSIPTPATGQVWTSGGRPNYLLVHHLDGRWQAIPLSGHGGWTYPTVTPQDAVKGLTFVRERI